MKTIKAWMSLKSVKIQSPIMELTPIEHLKTGFPRALENLENLENQKKKFHAWKNHGI